MSVTTSSSKQYVCSCPTGFQLSTDGHTCVGKPTATIVLTHCFSSCLLRYLILPNLAEKCGSAIGRKVCLRPWHSSSCRLRGHGSRSSIFDFLHHGIEEVERHLLWKFYKKIRRKSWSNVPPKLLACIGFLYKVVQKIGRLRKFIRSREIEFNFFTASTISMKFGTLVQHASGYKTLPQFFKFLPRDLVMVFQSRRNGVKSSPAKLWKIITKSLGKN